MAKFNKWEKVGKRVSVLGGPIANPKKITATRLGAVCGLNRWKTPFQAWCEITRVAEPPFEGNKYTLTGQVVEPRLNEFSKEFISPNLKTPEEYYDKPLGFVWDFFPDQPVFGGKWDALVTNRKGDKNIGIVEYKTTSRAQDWLVSPPDYYAIQALAYGAWEGLDDVWLVPAFLEQDDYVDPADYPGLKGAALLEAADKDCTFQPSEENTRIFPMNVATYKVAGKTIHEWLEYADAWHERHVEGNVSPEFDEKADKEYLDLMRTSEVEIPKDLDSISAKVATLDDSIKNLKESSGLNDMEKELKELKDKVLKAQMRSLADADGSTAIETKEWRLAQGKGRETIDKAAMKEDGVLEKYTTVSEGSWTLTRKKN